jgi:hypothetical protein
MGQVLAIKEVLRRQTEALRILKSENKIYGQRLRATNGGGGDTWFVTTDPHARFPKHIDDNWPIKRGAWIEFNDEDGSQSKFNPLKKEN